MSTSTYSIWDPRPVEAASPTERVRAETLRDLIASYIHLVYSSHPSHWGTAYIALHDACSRALSMDSLPSPNYYHSCVDHASKRQSLRDRGLRPKFHGWRREPRSFSSFPPGDEPEPEAPDPLELTHLDWPPHLSPKLTATAMLLSKGYSPGEVARIEGLARSAITRVRRLRDAFGPQVPTPNGCRIYRRPNRMKVSSNASTP